MSKGLEALDNLVQGCFNPCDSDEVLNDKAIVEKELKALDAIKENFTIEIDDIKETHVLVTVSRSGSMHSIFCVMSKEEGELLRGVLK